MEDVLNIQIYQIKCSHMMNDMCWEVALSDNQQFGRKFEMMDWIGIFAAHQ